MTTAPRPRHLALVPSPANDADLAASFADSTRRGDVIGAILRAAAAPTGAAPSSKTIGRPVDHVQRERERADEQAAAFTAGMLEAAMHGAHPDLVAALSTLADAMSLAHGEAAQQRVAALRAGVPMPRWYVAKLRRSVRQQADGVPPSGPRPLRALIDARREAADAVGELLGDVTPGCYRLGGVQPPAEQARDLADMMRELSTTPFSSGHVPRMARQAAQVAWEIGQATPALATKASGAVRKLLDLAELVERGGVG